ncbi:ATP-binding protein [Acidipila sp. EB88]|uniref:ATP-binding protein n=1 Tax=Acidipila sp. EB88 TaxID=2305226 RepID=UPI000F60032E|nr:ATP-binding protein [Acidipila sp. EB88]RRA47109.1 PAS domain-containing protein [Acidipila sp. EB88]
MERSLQTRVVALTLALLTVAAVLLAVLNFQQEQHFQRPTDGVWWSESQGALEADRVPHNSAGERAGIKAGDFLLSVNQQPMPRTAALAREWYHTKVYGSASYVISRRGIRIDVPVILDSADTSINFGERLIALVYLGIGLYVLLRRWTAPHATHFYIFCLASFAVYSFLYTGKLNAFDQVVYWAGIVAGALQPALFLHFALSFSSRSGRRKAAVLWLTYLPACLIIGLQVFARLHWQATGILAHRLDQIATAYLDAFYVLATVLFAVEHRRAGREDGQVLRRQQLKWLTRGSILSIVPFSVLYVFPYLLDIGTPESLRNLAILALVILPLTFAWAIVRYRLMDVDLIFKRGVTYTLATASLVGFYFVVVAVIAETVHTKLPAAGTYGLLAAIIITSALFDPVKRAIQNRVDRLFDRKRYDYRQTLIEFGKGLGTQTDLDHLLTSITSRLSQTLLVARVAVFLASGESAAERTDAPGAFRLAAAHGLPPALVSDAAPLALGFLDFDQPDAGTHIFLENPQQALHLADQERRTAAALELHYYLPCQVQDRTIAVIGLGRTTDGDFLSSEDVELLESLAGYIGIAIQNAALYASLQRKIEEFERLKEFNENIVESTNVGILALDLDERIESWNAQMEVLYAMPRAVVLGQRLADVFDDAFVREFHRVKDEPGVHYLYKFPLGTRGEAPGEENRVANISIAPLVSREFQTLGRIVLVDDITARVGLESQLAQAEKLSSIGLLAAGVAHEVNTPLAVISSYTQMLSKQLRDDAKLAPLLDKITKQTFRASEIVNGLLNFSRTGGAEFRATDLNAVVRETLALLEHQLKTARIELVCDLDPALPAIQGNNGKLQQVFLNLFLNAKDAMQDGGRLEVSTRYNGMVTVSVCDSGSGIAPEHVQRIYDPFFTTKSAIKEGQRRGTGLGLAVTYGIMQEHSGKIRVESQPGAGTTFALEFPLKEKPAHV